MPSKQGQKDEYKNLMINLEGLKLRKFEDAKSGRITYEEYKLYCAGLMDGMKATKSMEGQTK